MASIIVVSGPNTGDYYPVGKRTIVIGRDESCPVQITDDRASRKHFQIRLDDSDGRHHGLDMKSANGTWINGRRLESDIVLEDHDEITIGSSKVVYYKQDFTDRESAMSHYKQRGERSRPTIEDR